MAEQESIGEPAPLDVDPYWLPIRNGSRSSQPEPEFQFPSNDSQIEQIRAAEEAAKEIQTTVGRNQYLPLYHAAQKGDWESAISFIGRNRDLLAKRITTGGKTAVMVASIACKWKFVEKLVEILSPEQLKMTNTYGNTVLHFVALGGSVKIAKSLVRKCSALTQINNNDGRTPLSESLFRPNKKMVWYLTLVTRDELNSRTCPFTGIMSSQLVGGIIFAGFNDIALFLLRKYPDMEVVKNKGDNLLSWLSEMPSSFHGPSNLTFIEQLIYKFIHVEIGVPPPSQVLNALDSLGNTERLSALTTSIQSRSGCLPQVFHWLKMLLWKAAGKLVPNFKKIREAKLQRTCAIEIVKHACMKFRDNTSFQEVAVLLTDVMHSATKFGIVEIVRICLQHEPDLIFQPIAGEQNILQVAIKCRQDKIFNLITKMPIVSYISAGVPDESQNSAWHLSAKLAPSPQLLSVSGAALQMQRELQWFKEVEKLIHPMLKNETNADGKTALDVFMEEHKELAEEGEKWMKDTANSCMIVTTLVATVVFAAAFTVPGGNVGDTGVPIFLRQMDFLVFAISDALALFSSSISLLMFLSILTARYAQEDFLLRLPRRLIIGLGSLFFAIIAMMVAFGATFFMVLKVKWQSIYIPITILGCIPVLIFAKQQVPLFYEMVQSTYGSGVFNKKKKWRFPWRILSKWKFSCLPSH